MTFLVCPFRADRSASSQRKVDKLHPCTSHRHSDKLVFFKQPLNRWLKYNDTVIKNFLILSPRLGINLVDGLMVFAQAYITFGAQVLAPKARMDLLTH